MLFIYGKGLVLLYFAVHHRVLFFEVELGCVAKADLELVVLLPQPCSEP
jgi:hypothetical protein